MLELAKYEGAAAALMRALEVTPHFRELLRRRILERIDRLLLITDREDRPPAGPGAGAGGEFGDELADDLPLFAAGVLRFVDQKMVDAEVELVVNPGGVDIAQERKRFVDQSVIVDQAAAFLFALITLQDVVNDDQQGGRAIPAYDGAPPLQKRANPTLLGHQSFDQA